MSEPLTMCIREDIGQATVTRGFATVYAFLLVKPAQAGRAGVAALLSLGGLVPSALVHLLTLGHRSSSNSRSRISACAFRRDANLAQFPSICLLLSGGHGATPNCTRGQKYAWLQFPSLPGEGKRTGNYTRITP